MQAEMFTDIQEVAKKNGVSYVSAVVGFRNPTTGYVYATERNDFADRQTAEAFIESFSGASLKSEEVSGDEVRRLTDNKKVKTLTRYLIVRKAAKKGVK